MPHLNSPEASITPHGIAAPGSYLHDEEMLTRLIGRIYETAMQATYMIGFGSTPCMIKARSISI